MAGSGFLWDASWSAMQKGAGDWTADAIADNATETGDAFLMCPSQVAHASVDIGIACAEDNTGAIDGKVTVYVLRDVDGTNYEEPGVGGAYSFQFTPVQNDVVYLSFGLDALVWSAFKIAFKNEGGQELAFTVKYKFSTVPLAS